jgi:hypothetical protein
MMVYLGGHTRPLLSPLAPKHLTLYSALETRPALMLVNVDSEPWERPLWRRRHGSPTQRPILV